MKDLEKHKCTTDTFNDKPIFKIVKVDEEGEEIEKYSTVISFGVKKAAYIVENFEEIKQFVEENKDK